MAKNRLFYCKALSLGHSNSQWKKMISNYQVIFLKKTFVRPVPEAEERPPTMKMPLNLSSFQWPHRNANDTSNILNARRGFSSTQQQVLFDTNTDKSWMFRPRFSGGEG